MKVLAPVSFTRISTSALLLLSLATIGAAQAGPARGNQSGGRQPAPIRIDNFGRISPTYYRGAQPQGRDYADLAALGVKTVINLTSYDAMADEQELVAGGRHEVRGDADDDARDADADSCAFLDIVNDPANGPVFVHCVGGKHRTGVMTRGLPDDPGRVDGRAGVQGDEAVQFRRRLPAPRVQEVRPGLPRAGSRPDPRS